MITPVLYLSQESPRHLHTWRFVLPTWTFLLPTWIFVLPTWIFVPPTQISVRPTQKTEPNIIDKFQNKHIFKDHLTPPTSMFLSRKVTNLVIPCLYPPCQHDWYNEKIFENQLLYLCINSSLSSVISNKSTKIVTNNNIKIHSSGNTRFSENGPVIPVAAFKTSILIKEDSPTSASLVHSQQISTHVSYKNLHKVN